jgi:hypothetical protein
MGREGTAFSPSLFLSTRMNAIFFGTILSDAINESEESLLIS